ncbi:MAG: thioredoxin-dependent thiol peroxidase [Elusimicrobia bacterium]|nr:thioredoxin-dependent thiol peroxidase [Elusimicrobiota bacterium]
MPAPKGLEIGDTAPDFALPDEQGQLHRLSGYRGKSVVLYFYPKDATPGCTQEACDFRDSFAGYRKRNAVVLGVSPDTARSHEKFKRKHELPFPLLADADRTVCGAYGVWKEKTLYGRKFMGVERSTFVIDPEGRVRLALRKVRVPGHVAEVLKQL